MNSRPTYEELERRVEELERTVSRQRDEALACRDSEAKYQAIVEAIDGLVYVCSGDHRIEFMNQRLIERTGHDATGESCYRVLHNRDSVCPWCVNERVFSGETVRWEVRSPKDDRWYYVINSPIHYANGRISKQAVILDVTERKRIQELLSGELDILERVATGRPLKETLAALVDLAESLMGHVFCSLVAYDRERKRYRHLAAPRVPLGLINQVDEGLAERLFDRLGGKRLHEDFLDLTQEDAPWLEHRAVAERYGLIPRCAIPVRDGARQLLACFILYYRKSATDASGDFELMRTAARLAAIAIQRHDMEGELRSSAERIKMFSYSVTHDLKSPSTALYGLTRRLNRIYKEELDEKGQRYCDQILKSAEQIAILVEKINLYIRAKELPLTIEPVNLHDVLDGLRGEFMERMEERGIEWREPAQLPPSVSADRTAITRILRNLVENALFHAGGEMTRIQFGYDEDDDFHILSVADNGAGIPLEDTDKLFELFQCFKSSARAKGAGLGLAIVKEIAGQHGGRVWVGPTPGQGTTFYISISKRL